MRFKALTLVGAFLMGIPDIKRPTKEKIMIQNDTLKKPFGVRAHPKIELQVPSNFPWLVGYCKPSKVKQRLEQVELDLRHLSHQVDEI